MRASLPALPLQAAVSTVSVLPYYRLLIKERRERSASQGSLSNPPIYLSVSLLLPRAWALLLFHRPSCCACLLLLLPTYILLLLLLLLPDPGTTALSSASHPPPTTLRPLPHLSPARRQSPAIAFHRPRTLHRPSTRQHGAIGPRS